MNATVSILTEIPEQLHESLKGYLETHPDWDQDRVFTAALSLFLLQNGNSDRQGSCILRNYFPPLLKCIYDSSNTLTIFES